MGGETARHWTAQGLAYSQGSCPVHSCVGWCRLEKEETARSTRFPSEREGEYGIKGWQRGCKERAGVRADSEPELMGPSD